MSIADYYGILPVPLMSIGVSWIEYTVLSRP